MSALRNSSTSLRAALKRPGATALASSSSSSRVALPSAVRYSHQGTTITPNDLSKEEYNMSSEYRQVRALVVDCSSNHRLTCLQFFVFSPTR